MNTNLIDYINKIDTKETYIDFVSKAINADDIVISTEDKQLLTARAKELRCLTEVKRMFTTAAAINTEFIAAAPYIVNTNGKERVSPEKLADYIEETKHYFFVQSPDSEEGRLFWYNNGVYRHISKSLAKGYIKDIISQYNRELATVKVLNETMQQLEYSHSPLHTIESDEELNNNFNLINFENGMLNLDTMQLDAHSPSYKSTIQIPCKWCSSPAPTPVFDRYIQHLANEDSAAIQTLLEMIGFSISNIPIEKYKKSLFIVGKGDSGKTQFPNLLIKLIGNTNSCAMPFSKLEARFQATGLYHKRLAVDGDCRAVNCQEISTFKSMTGGDDLQAEPKGKMPFSFKYHGLYIVLANDLPLFGGDRGEHVYRRIIPIQCGDTIPESERDPNILDKLYSERAGIITKAVLAVKRTIDNGYKFTIGESSLALLEQYKIENDSVLKFLDECCIETEQLKGACTAAQVWGAFTEWCKDNGEFRPKRSYFVKAIADKCKIPKYSVLKASNGKRYYPFTIKPELKADFHIFDSIAE